MIIYYYGPDSYRRNKKVQETVRAYKKARDNFDIVSFDLEENEDDWMKVRDFLLQPSMFVQSKLAIVRGLSSVDKAEWVKILKNYIDSEEKIFIVGSDKKKPTKKFNFLLKEPVRFQEFQELGSRELVKLVNKLSKEYGVKFEKRAENLFVSFIISGENRAEKAENELFKLSCLNFKDPITINDLGEIIDWRFDEEMYKAVRNMVGTSDPFKRVALLEELLTRNNEIDYVFNSAVYQIRGDDLLKFGDYDVMRKSGKIEPEEALLDFALKDL